MKESHLKRKILVMGILLLLVIESFGLIMVYRGAKQTISFIPDVVSNLIYTYLDICKSNPEEAVAYTHFETEFEREAFIDSPKQINNYKILGAEAINEDLYVFTINIQKEIETYPKRYYFVGEIDSKLYVMVNVWNIPEELKTGLNVDRYTLTQDDLSGDIPISPGSIVR